MKIIKSTSNIEVKKTVYNEITMVVMVVVVVVKVRCGCSCGSSGGGGGDFTEVCEAMFVVPD